MTAGERDPGRRLVAAILSRFTPGLGRPTIVRDPERLLREAGVLAALERRGFDFLFLDDPIAFRFDYEARFRPRWDDGETLDLVIVVGDEETEPPFDLTDGAERVSLRLGDFFTRLSPTIVRELDPTERERLYVIQQQAGDKALGADESRDFVLRHLFGVTPETVREPADLLTLLLERHYAERQVSASLDDRFLRVLESRGIFEDWPLGQLLRDRNAFLSFLDERWLRFLDRRAGHTEHRPSQAIPGPADLPFDDPRVRAYLDTLFLEGLLTPVEHDIEPAPDETWIRVGIRRDAPKAQRRRAEHLLRVAEDRLPSEVSGHHAWRKFARRWGEARATFLRLGDADSACRDRFRRLEQQADEAFAKWLPAHYGPLSTLPPSAPVMLHHVPHRLARGLGGAGSRAALLVLDGLALPQWAVLREELTRQRPALQFQEDAVFAWIPTLTAVSRQALFAGRPPFHFENSIATTATEATHWRRFMRGCGLGPAEIAYRKKFEAADPEAVETLLADPKPRAVAIVVNTVDDIMHGTPLGERGMLNQVRHWAEGPFLCGLLDRLLDGGFTVWLTSDHGNVEARGLGRPAEGALSNLRGERVRIFQDEALRRQVAKRFPEATAWPPLGLPGGFLPLLAPGRCAFVPEGKTVVCHGGANLEEVIVPLVRITRQPA